MATQPGFSSHHLSPAEMDQFFELVHELAALPVCAVDQGLRFLLARACTLLEADDAFWISALYRPGSDHPMAATFKGWLPVQIVSLADDADRHALRQLILERSRQGQLDPFTAALVKQAGNDRALLRADVLGPASAQDSWMQREVFAPGLLRDRMVGACSLSRESETYLGFDRSGTGRPFGPRERDLLRLICIGLKWFFAGLHRSYGLIDARETLTAREREVLLQVLTDKSEKVMAADLGMKSKTLHHYITVLYRKFEVKSRAGLMALWLNYRGDSPGAQTREAACQSAD